MVNAQMVEVSEQLGAGARQSYSYELIVKVGEQKLRVKLHIDSSYANQSSGSVSVWNGAWCLVSAKQGSDWLKDAPSSHSPAHRNGDHTEALDWCRGVAYALIKVATEVI